MGFLLSAVPDNASAVADPAELYPSVAIWSFRPTNADLLQSLKVKGPDGGPLGVRRDRGRRKGDVRASPASFKKIGTLMDDPPSEGDNEAVE
jgi:hypothetical protein